MLYNILAGDNMSLISVKNLDYKKNKKEILKDINLNIDEGSFVSIIGSNSSGKTTLLKIISGLIPTNNKVSINHGYISLKREHKDIVKLGLVFNDLNKFLFNDVYEELTFPLENLNIESEEQQKIILNLADFLEINDLLDKKTDDLKQEEKQLVLIALALIHKPQILILDNPFSMMKTSTKQRIISKLKQLQKVENTTIILSTNNLEDIVDTDYTYVLDNGEIVIEGKTLSVLQEDILLKKLGIELPFSINLSLMLKFYEIYDNLETDYNEVIKKLWN